MDSVRPGTVATTVLVALSITETVLEPNSLHRQTGPPTRAPAPSMIVINPTKTHPNVLDISFIGLLSLSVQTGASNDAQFKSRRPGPAIPVGEELVGRNRWQFDHTRHTLSVTSLTVVREQIGNQRQVAALRTASSRRTQQFPFPQDAVGERVGEKNFAEECFPTPVACCRPRAPLYSVSPVNIGCPVLAWFWLGRGRFLTTNSIPASATARSSWRCRGSVA